MDKAKDFEKGWKEYKAKRNQEIEELAKVLCVNRKPLKCKDCVIRGMCEFKETAKEVYDAGYRKIDENSVVLTREEAEQVYGTVKNHGELLKDLQEAKSVFEKEMEEAQKEFVKQLEEDEKEIRKETAEKFAREFINDILPKIMNGHSEKALQIAMAMENYCKEFTGD